MSSASPGESPDYWMLENAAGFDQRTSSLDVDTPVHSHVGPMPTTLVHQRLPDLPSAAQFQVLPTQVHPTDGLASESHPPQALAESRRQWMLEHAPSDYQRIYSSDADSTPVHFPFESLPAALGQQYLPGLPHNGERVSQNQFLTTQVHPNDAVASESQVSQTLAESRHLWMLDKAPIHSSDADSTPVHFQFESLPAALGHQRLPGLPYEGERAAQLQVLSTQSHPNDVLASESQVLQALAESRRLWMLENAPSDYQKIYSSDADGTPVHFQFESLSAALGQQRLLGPPYDGESATHLQVSEGEPPPDVPSQSQLSPPGLTQVVGGAQEQPTGAAQLTSAQEAEHSSAAGGKQSYSCKRCVKIIALTRPQDLVRHNREVHGDAGLDKEVHDLDSPRKCPHCPQERRQWKRHSLMKKHLIDDHHDKFAMDVLNRIQTLKGRDVFDFVDTIEPPQS